MMIVSREPEFLKLVEIDVRLGEDRGVRGDRLRNRRVEGEPLIGIGEIGEGRHQYRKRRLRFGGADEERNMVFGLAGTQPQRIDPALDVVGNRQRQAWRPQAVGQRVVVEGDAAILLRVEAEAVGAAGPVPAGHAADRAVDAPGGQPVRADVFDRVANSGIGIAGRGVPMRGHGVQRRQFAPGELLDGLSRQRPIGDAGAVDLAGIEHADEAAAAVVLLAGTGPEKWSCGARIERSDPQRLDDPRVVVERARPARAANYSD